ncbi:Regulator of Vps4 activity in the MVB pathway [Nesidiocoris tenuis]|uniref:IST1 homolog n=1 Tax=Nesidiocoris tenuis TaxID=355587 RepID=A0ABN7ASM0_9HEMI|nr:Regulator of Vps4 activity in the MVB pathway [Nesidiocoris tenuis]
MFSSGPNYPKLKTNLRLAVNRLKLLEKKKTELAQKARKEIADYISDGKCERAKIRVEHIIREDYMVEAMELIEMYCDILLSRFGLLQEIKGMDPSLAEAISSLLWVAPRLGNECEELKVISDQLTGKYGKKYAEACRVAGVDTISEKLRHKMSVQAPPKILVEKYLIEIAKIYNIAYEPDPHVMKEYEQSKGMDALLFDAANPNNLDGNVVRPPGFVDFPPPPVAPQPPPFSYPSIYPTPGFNPDFEPNMMSEPPPFAYNIPPSNATPAKKNDPPKTINSTEQPKPLPRSKMSPDMSIPDLPSVPSDTFPTDDQDDADECDFQDIVRRFDELNKKK